MLKVLAIALASTMCASAADATLLTYDISGIFTDGSTLSGSFIYDDSGTDINQFESASIVLSSAGSFSLVDLNGVTSDPYYNPSGYILVFQRSPLYLQLALASADHNGSAVGGILSSNLSGLTYYSTDDRNTEVFLDSGTVTRASVVPEPVSWAMMIGGLGLVGGAMRRNKVKVSFA
jgi:hypothetical protein